MKKFTDREGLPLPGSRIEVLSCKRSDGADAFSGYKGEVELSSSVEDGFVIKGENSILIISSMHLHNFKWRHLVQDTKETESLAKAWDEGMAAMWNELQKHPYSSSVPNPKNPYR